ncbi:S-layer homology domain-containing protein [Paenibacillus sp. M1]|uniref:S-layer homology domain-containing protein n=1 Tax=Paenibacillus haidiansis TaxID=1574488 RepID=A0ABU7VT97_9BACL
MKINQKFWLITLISAVMIGLNAGPVFAGKVLFQDVSPSYWGYEGIQWAIENKVVTGYSDDQFRPDQTVKQSEFLAMLIRAFGPSDFQPDPTLPWDSAYVNYAERLGWHISPSNPPLSRGMAAQLIANATGKNYGIDESVQYLLDIGLAGGKTAKTVAGYGKEDTLSRAEAVSLIKIYKQKFSLLQPCSSVKQLYNRDENVIVYRNNSFHFTLSLPVSWKEKYEVMDSTRREAPNHHNFHFINKSSTSSGILFTLSVWPEESWQSNSNNMIENIPVIKKLGELEGNVYFFHLPTDVQYDPNDENDVQNFNSMFEDVKTIISSFELLP